MSQIQIPIYFLKKTGQIAYKYITLEELYRLYHKRKYTKNEEFVQKFITENDIDYIEEDGKRKNLYYTSLEELKKKCEEKGKPIKNHLQKQDVKDYEVEEITIGESTKNPSFFYGVDMYGNIIKFTMSSKTEKQLSEDDKHEIVRQYKLVYNPTGKKDESGRIGFRVSTFGRDAKLDDIIEDVTDMVAHKGNAIQDVPGQLKVIDFPQNDLEENSDKKKDI